MIYALVFILCFWNLGDLTLQSTWASRWVFLLSIPVALCIFNIFKERKDKYFWPGALTLSVWVSGLYASFWIPRYINESFEVQTSLRQVAAQGVIIFTALALFTTEMKTPTLKKILQAFAYAAPVAAAVILIQWALGVNVQKQVWFFDQPGMAASQIIMGAFLLPWLPRSKKWIALLWAIVALSTLVTGATTPLLALIAGFMVYAISAKRLSTVSVLVPLASLLGAVIYFPLQHLATDSGRLKMWLLTVKWWAQQDFLTILLGTGPATTRIILPILETEANGGFPLKTYHFWLHNDWLQVLIELGVVGAVAVLGLMATVFIKSWKSPALCASFTSLAVTAFFNFPVHWPVHAAFAFVICEYILREADHG